MTEAASAINVDHTFHFMGLILTATAARYVMNKMPWIQPVHFTASGKPIRYFSGIATNSSTKKETPSALAINLKFLIPITNGHDIEKTRSF